jgi:hypothetical protein
MELISMIKQEEPIFYNAAKEYFCYKQRVNNEFIRVYGKETLEEIIATHNFNKIVDNGSVTNNYPPTPEGRMAKKLNEKYKEYLSQAWIYKGKYNAPNFVMIFDLLQKHFK